MSHLSGTFFLGLSFLQGIEKLYMPRHVVDRIVNTIFIYGNDPGKSQAKFDMILETIFFYMVSTPKK